MVALSDVLPPNTITAARRLAVNPAGIIILRVAIVAGFNAIAYMPVTAPGDGAIDETVIGLKVVPIIALFFTQMKNTIAAARGLTGDETAVAVDAVSIVTFFARVDSTVTTVRSLTSGIAAVIIDIVSIIAFFKTRFAFLRVQTAYAITAKRCATTIQARIPIEAVSIITVFIAWIAFSEI